MQDDEARIAFVGLGEMGLPMVRNLVNAGFAVDAVDIQPDRMRLAAECGAAASSVSSAVASAAFVLTSLPSSETFVRVAEEALLSCVREGRTVIDLGTVAPPETRRLAEEFGRRGVSLVDVPVSGGPQGVERGTLRMFAAGDREAVERSMPLLRAVGGADARIVYCGPSGNGQVVKGVNQLMMGLGNAAYLEAVAFGVNAGVAPEVLLEAVGGEGRRRRDFAAVAKAVANGTGNNVGVKYRELPYFLQEVEDGKGGRLPLTETLYRFCSRGDTVTVDDHRPAPAFWHELSGRFSRNAGSE